MADKYPDIHEIKCKICGQLKKRIRVGSFKKKIGKTPCWEGEDGLLFNGLVCGQCHRNQTAVRQAIKRVLGE